jgi:DNA-binding NarL/FixJ family response regulator
VTAGPVPQPGIHRAPHVLVVPAEIWDLTRAALVTQGLQVQAVATPVGQPLRHSVRLGHDETVALTDREQQVLLLLATGARHEDIARSLCLSAHTIRSHQKTLFRKLGVHDRSEAVAVGYQRGFLGGAA